MLLDHGGKEYLPDKKGLYPIDYAGFFGNHESVKVLVDHSLKKVKLAQTYNE